MIEAYSEQGFVKFSSSVFPHLFAMDGSFTITTAASNAHPIYQDTFFYPRSTPGDAGVQFAYFELAIPSNVFFEPLLFFRPQLNKWISCATYTRSIINGVNTYLYVFRGEPNTVVNYKIVDKNAVPSPIPSNGIQVNNSIGDTVFHSGLNILSIVSSLNYLSEGQTISGYPISTYTTPPLLSYDNGNLFFLAETLIYADVLNINDASGMYNRGRSIGVRINSQTSYSARMMDFNFNEGNDDRSSLAYGRPRIIYRCR